MALDFFNLQGINTYNNFLQSDGIPVHLLNVVGFPNGGYSKRPGYGTAIGTVGARVNTLFSYAPYPTSGGTTLFLYAAAGSLLQYSAQGTAAWAVAQGSTAGDSGGTIANGNHLGYSALNNVLIVGDGAGSTRHTTNGSQFSNTQLAPIAQYISQFHNRIYTSEGTSANLQFSVSNDATNWNTGGTSDSSSFVIPNEGGILSHFVAGDRLNIVKQRGDMFNWDDTTLVDMSTQYGPSSPWGLSHIDDMWFWMNQYGIFNFDGATKNLISNPIQRHFYNRLGNGIGTATWGSAPAVAHIWDYMVAVGTVTDDFTGRTVSNCIERYDFQKNQFTYWSFANAPTAWHSYNDINNKRQLIFGDTQGNIFQLDPTKTSDAGAPIQSEVVLLFTYNAQGEQITQQSTEPLLSAMYEQKWNYARLAFNPGDEVNIQWAFSNTFTYQHLKWSEAINTNNRTGDFYQVSDGVVEIRFPINDNNSPRSRFMFVRIYDNSDNSAWTLYGIQVDAETQVVR